MSAEGRLGGDSRAVRGCGVRQVLVQDREPAWKAGNLEAVAVQDAALRRHAHARASRSS
ncbi:hypothetical protein AB0M92_04950 [Streptomyces sp. NPDC051582]|uniref:hypothetical protein n=1 Tax=Streptomyces sp. NPDC051582 TaxID=3155167 RepID=UPI0034365B16